MQENKQITLTADQDDAVKKLENIQDRAERHFPKMSLIVAPDKKLNLKSELITQEDFNNGSIEVLTEVMSSTMRALKGIGLSAIQLNIAKQVFVINHTLSAETAGKRVFINPKISNLKGELFTEEGCLSFPGLYVPVRRAEALTIEALDEKGNPFTLNVEGFTSIVLQHEFDHLQGITFLEKISKLKRDFYKKKYQKIRAKDG